MIGDRLDNDIASAKKIGMKTIWVRQGFARYQSVKNESERPDHTVESIRDIRNRIRSSGSRDKDHRPSPKSHL